jgi:hypothetical protein
LSISESIKKKIKQLESETIEPKEMKSIAETKEMAMSKGSVKNNVRLETATIRRRSTVKPVMISIEAEENFRRKVKNKDESPITKH